MPEKLFEYINRFYLPEEYPALTAQAERWRKSRPLAGKRIFDATPVFRNTMVKYYALLCAGAEVTAAVGKNIPCDVEICRILPQFGIRVADAGIERETFDVVADCAASSRQVKSRSGYVELTRSGLEYYRNWKQPVFSADSGVLKKLETILGTGEGFLRAMRQLKYDSFSGKKVLIFLDEYDTPLNEGVPEAFHAVMPPQYHMKWQTEAKTHHCIVMRYDLL
jgi:adenosylhomocysteinase